MTLLHFITFHHKNHNFHAVFALFVTFCFCFCSGKVTSFTPDTPESVVTFSSLVKFFWQFSAGQLKITNDSAH